jgi:hypothetical protein
MLASFSGAVTGFFMAVGLMLVIERYVPPRRKE